MTAFTRSPTWWLSPGICSLRGRSASLLPSETIAVPASTRVTCPTTSSPFLPANSLKTVSDSASRIFWMIICLADCAAMRPSVSGSSSDLAVAGDDVAGGLVDGDEDAFLDAEVPFGGDLDGRGDAAEDDLRGIFRSSWSLSTSSRIAFPGSLSFAHDASALPPETLTPAAGYAPRRGCRADSPGFPAEPTPDTPTRAALGRCIVGSWFLTGVLSPPFGPKARAHTKIAGVFALYSRYSVRRGSQGGPLTSQLTYRAATFPRLASQNATRSLPMWHSAIGKNVVDQFSALSYKSATA